MLLSFLDELILAIDLDDRNAIAATIEGFSQVGFKAGAHGVLRRRCRRDLVQDGVWELPWDERGIVGLLAGKMVGSLLGSGDGFKVMAILVLVDLRT
nr:hypothetical protein [Tanacetum cinerariifolium]